MARPRTWTDRATALLALGVMALLAACAATPEHSAETSPEQSLSQALSQSLSLQAPDAQRADDTATQPLGGQVDGEVDSVAPAAGAEDQTICRTEVVTGTHRPTRICLTRAERSAMREAAQDWYRSGGRNGAVTQIPGVR